LYSTEGAYEDSTAIASCEIKLETSRKSRPRKTTKQTRQKRRPINGAFNQGQCILCSTAVRATQTAEMIVKYSGFKGKVDYLDSFYLAEPNVYLEGLQTLPDEIERVMIIGHNPGMEGLLQILSGQVESLPTSSMAHIVLPVSQWKELNLDTEGDLVEKISPEDLKEKEKSKEKEKAKGKVKEKEKGKKKK
jgi:phosphohistidine phosphatase